jgi:4-amino-4-deoxy-L-arabinose transferase-like glycosyltransferase
LVAVSGAAVAGIVLSFAPAEWKRVAASYAKAEYLSVGQVIDHFFSRLGPGVAHFGSPLVAYTTIPLLIASMCGVVDGLRRHRPEMVALLAAWAVVPFAAAALSATFAYPRYTLASFPALAVLAGCGLVAVVEWLRPRFTRRWLAPALAVVAFGPALIFDARVLASPRHAHYPGLDDAQYVSGFAAGPPWPALADKLRGLAPRGPVEVAWGARGVGPVGLAAELGAPKLAEGTVNAGFFTARTDDGRLFAFTPYAEHPQARFVVAQDVDAIPLPPAVEKNYRVVTVAKRPHDGSSVALLERR